MTTMTAGLKLLPKYQDVTIELVERRRQHWYRVSNEPELLPSVTTFLKIIDKSGPLTGWATKTAFAAMESTLNYHGATLKPDDYGPWASTVLEVAKDRAKEARSAGADKGEATHELIADLFHGGQPKVPDDLAPAVRGAREFVADYGLAIEALEVPVWHPGVRYAGTVDFVGRNQHGNLVLADWKRSNGIYPEHGYQVAAYADAVEALTGMKVAHCYVVRLPKEGGEDAGYECRELLNRDLARMVYENAKELWETTRAAKAALWR